MNKRGYAAFLKKAVFTLSGRLLLMDPVRNFVYQWTWSCLQGLPRTRGPVLDIGSRASPFPAFLAWRGFNVVAVDPYPQFVPRHNEIRRAWNVSYRTVNSDVSRVPADKPFPVVLALLSLQHAGDGDVDGYRTAGEMLGPNGMLLTVNEFDSRGTRLHRGRPDGDMRIYGPDDISERIEKPLAGSGVTVTQKRFAARNRTSHTLAWTENPERAGFCFLLGTKGGTSPNG